MTNYLSAFLLSCALLALPACGGGGGGGGDADGGVVPDADPNVVPTAFRASQITLLDPHAFAFSNDVNDLVNDAIAHGVTQDMSNPVDNKLDLSMAVVFLPLDTAGAATPMNLTFPSCSAPLASTMCSEDATTTIIPTTATNMDTTCLEALPGTVTPYDPPVVPVPAPCFVTGSVDVTVALGSVTLPLQGAQFAATYDGSEPTTLSGGLLRGFVTKTDADNTLIPEGVPLVAGEPLSSLLKPEDMDMGPDGSAGWWFYLAVEAEVVPYTTL